MADPFSIAAGVVGVTDVAVKTSSKLRSLISEFRDAPKLILDLSNEATEISFVLERFKESQQAVQSLHEPQHDAAFLAAFNDQLTKARSILMDLESLAATLSTANSSTERFKWLRKKKHAANLKNKLRAVTGRMNEMLVAHNPSLGSRIKLELHEVRIGMRQAHADVQTAIQTANSNFQATNSELVAICNTVAQQQTVVNSEIQTVRDAVSLHTAEAASHRLQINDQLSRIHNTIHTGSQTFDHIQTEQIRQFKAIETVRDTVSVQTAESAAHRQLIDAQLSTIHNTISTGSQALSRIQAEQTKQFDATQTVQVAILNELAAFSGTSMVRVQAGSSMQPVPSHNNPNSVVFFSLRLPGFCCADSCGCKCHLPARPNISLRVPPILRSAVGSLFLGYNGYPSSSARCDVQSCATGKYVRFQASYSFPLWQCLRYVIHASIEASTSGIFTFTLVAKRRIPWTPGSILYEAQYGTAATVAHVLRHERGCIQDIYEVDGKCALRLATSSTNPGKIEIIRLLLQEGADLNHEDDDGITVRTWISENIILGRFAPDEVRALEGLFPSLSIEALGLSYIHKLVLGIIPIPLSLVLQKPVVHMLNAKSRFGLTPLMYTAAQGNVAAVQALIDAGAEVNQIDFSGASALFYAARSKKEGSTACVDALLQAGSDCNAVTESGESPLHWAIAQNCVTNACRLIDAGADVQAQTKRYKTPMYYAVYCNAVDIVRYLYNAGASLESEDNNGDTPLFAAIENSGKEAAILLLRLGVNTTHVNRKQRTLLHYAARLSSLNMMRTLRDVSIRGQDATARDEDGFTAQQLLEKRQPIPTPEMRKVFTQLEQTWCRPKEADDGVSDEEDCFHDAVEFLDSGLAK
ncbi:hypothetical protein F5Y03DRAFT_338577 [Xylaria venustula]|nr:hypothetical protein F5Y03DRAFT_338577 [Xylaria venustula]